MRGSVYVNNGYWVFETRLPGEKERRKHGLCAPGATHAMRGDRPREMALAAAHRIWEAAARRERREAPGCSVSDLCDAYARHVDEYYKGSGEASACTCATRILREMFGALAVGELKHTDLVRVREAFVRHGYTRNTCNKYTRIITNRMMPWAFDEGLINATTKAEMAALMPLKRGRTEAQEGRRVHAASTEHIEAAQACMMPNTADMVDVHRLTGMRPGEICQMRWADIDESQTPWVYRPRHHKNEWRDQVRVVLIGPRARAILERHRDGEYPFSPIMATVERIAELRAKRTSPFYPCRNEKFSRADPHAVRKPGPCWNTATYSRTIRAACERAGIAVWSANQLRHSFATEVRRRFGLAAASAVLGHSQGARVTDRYSFEAAEDEIIAAARDAVEALG